MAMAATESIKKDKTSNLSKIKINGFLILWYFIFKSNENKMLS